MIVVLLPLTTVQVQEMESARHAVVAHSSDELISLRTTCEELQREGDELKEVLSAVQLDLEAKTAVGHTHTYHQLCLVTMVISQELQEKEAMEGVMSEHLVELEGKVCSGEEENQKLRAKVTELEDQLKMAAVASQRKLSEMQSCHRTVGERLRETLQLHEELTMHFDS